MQEEKSPMERLQREDKESLEKQVREITEGNVRNTLALRPYPGREHYVPTHVSAGVTEN